MRAAKIWMVCCAALALLGSGCDLLQKSLDDPLLKPAPACGSFDLKTEGCGELQTCRKLVCGGIPGPRPIVTFRFEPKLCDQTCSCRTIAMVQALRLKRPDRSDITISDSQSARTIHSAQEPILDGWAIDRGLDATTNKDWRWGYYEMNDDGKTFDSFFSPGSDATPATLWDGPGTSQESFYTVEGLDVPVCLDPQSSCLNRALGYYVWGWSVSGSTLHARQCGTDPGWLTECTDVSPDMCERIPVKHGVAMAYYKKAFCLALKAWNANLEMREAFPPELIADTCAGLGL